MSFGHKPTTNLRSAQTLISRVLYCADLDEDTRKDLDMIAWLLGKHLYDGKIPNQWNQSLVLLEQQYPLNRP